MILYSNYKDLADSFFLDNYERAILIKDMQCNFKIFIILLTR